MAVPLIAGALLLQPATVTVSDNPAGVAITPDGRFAYVTDNDSGTVSVIGTTTSPPAVVAAVAVGSGPYDVAITPDGRFAYVTNLYSGTVSVIPVLPTVTALSPASGPAGTTVTLTGTNLSGASVSFGGKPAAAVSCTETSCTATAPAGFDVGTVDVTVTTAGGTSVPGPATRFSYVAPLDLTTTSLPAGSVGSPYSATLAATGGTTRYTFAVSAGALSAGLQLDADTGAISGTPSAAGMASFTVTVTDAGSPTPQRASKGLSIFVAKATQTITFPAPVGVTYGQPDADLGATASSGLPVTYASSTPGVCTIVAGKLHVVSAGTCTITASQPGNADYDPAASVTRTFTVTKADTTTVLTASPAAPTFGQPVTLTATVHTSPGAGTPTGTVTFSDGATVLGSAPLNASGQATLTASTLQPGAHPITASYAGDAGDNASSGTLTLPVACTRTLTGTVAGNLVVSSGATCLSGATVAGSVTVKPGAALALTGATVNGGISSAGASALTLCGSTIHGNVVVRTTAGYLLLGGLPGRTGCAGNTIDGSVSLAGNRGQLQLAGNQIGGNVSVTATRGAGPDPGHTTSQLADNTIDGALACSANTPPPSDAGSPSTVSGKRSGQCSGSL